jgi:diguanylate cyclase (GGDEF)-like protein/PAS domain S-box-containing protein
MVARDDARPVRPYRILIADDDSSVLEALADAIRDEPSLELVGAAGTVGAALELARLHHPDVAIVDVRMPDGGGQRLAAELTKGPRPIRVLALSGSDEGVVSMLQAGAQSYISKSETDLVDLILRFCRGNVILSSVEGLTDLVAGNEELTKQTRVLKKAARAEHGQYLRRLRSIFDSALDAVVTMDAEGKITDWNPMAETIFGWPRSEVVGRLMSGTIIPARYREVHQRGLQRFLKTGEGPLLNKRLELEALHRDGHEFPVEISIAATPSGNGYMFSAFLRDIGERRQADRALKASEERYRRIVETAFEGIWVIDAQHTTTFVNARMAEMLGYTAEEMLGKPVFNFLDDVARQSFAANQQGRLEGRLAQHEIRYIRKDGSECWTLLGVRPNFDEAGNYTGALAMVTDITERRKAASHDALTGLPNRLLLAERVTQALVSARASGRPASLLMLDLDNFKEVNETFGHQAGDSLLEQVGPRLRQQLKEADLLARLGGDEFAALLPDTDRALATTVAAKLLETLDQPFEMGGQLFDIAASIGVASFPLDGDSVESLLRRAEIALFVAKRSRGVCVSYAPEYEKHGASRLTMMADLRVALQQEQLRLHFQPLVSLRNRSVSGVEALVRWEHPARGMVPPGEFVPFAEKTRLIQPLTRWVIRTALRQCRAWHEAGRTIPVSVNIAMRDLIDPHFPDLVGTLLLEANVQPSWLRLEITEGVIMAEPERAIDTLGQLRKLGVRLAIDDFGTGYSSLAYLHRLPVDEIKIDRSFVSRMAGASSRANIVRASVDLGHSLRLESVAEGVEDARTWDLLAALGCDTAQGFYVSRPLPSDEVLPWLLRWEAAESAGIRRIGGTAA